MTNGMLPYSQSTGSRARVFLMTTLTPGSSTSWAGTRLATLPPTVYEGAPAQPRSEDSAIAGQWVPADLCIARYSALTHWPHSPTRHR